jgi:hypothetical protein
VLGNGTGMRLRLWCRTEDCRSWGICEGVLVRVLRYKRVRSHKNSVCNGIVLTPGSRWFEYVAAKKTFFGWILYSRCIKTKAIFQAKVEYGILLLCVC